MVCLLPGSRATHNKKGCAGCPAGSGCSSKQQPPEIQAARRADADADDPMAGGEDDEESEDLGRTESESCDDVDEVMEEEKKPEMDEKEDEEEDEEPEVNGEPSSGEGDQGEEGDGGEDGGGRCRWQPVGVGRCPIPGRRTMRDRQFPTDSFRQTVRNNSISEPNRKKRTACGPQRLACNVKYRHQQSAPCTGGLWLRTLP
jgi:hypothetical protein